MDFAELKKKDSAQLQKLLQEKRDQLRQLRFQAAAKQLKNIREVREVRKTVAKILTALHTVAGDTASKQK